MKHTGTKNLAPLLFINPLLTAVLFSTAVAAGYFFGLFDIFMKTAQGFGFIILLSPELTAVLSILFIFLITGFIQWKVLFPKTVIVPLRNLINGVNSLARGNRRTAFSGFYPGEIGDLRKALDAFITNAMPKDTPATKNRKDFRDEESEAQDTPAVEPAPLPVQVVQDFSAGEFLREIESLAISLRGAREIEIIADNDESFESLTIAADRAFLKQAVANLVVNALAETHQGTLTILPTLIVGQGYRYFEIAVANAIHDVPGVPLPHTDRESHRAGLFSQEHMERFALLLKGSFEAESTPGKGSVSTITIPLESPPASSGKETYHEQQRADRQT